MSAEKPAKRPTEHVVKEEFIDGTFRLLDGREVASHPKPKILQICTHLPEKWLFVDMESGQVWDSRYNIASSANIGILRQIVDTLEQFKESRTDVKMSGLYKEKSAVVEAMQFCGTNFRDIFCFCENTKLRDGVLYLIGPVRDTKIEAGEWLIKGTDESVYILSDEEFSKRYETIKA